MCWMLLQKSKKSVRQLFRWDASQSILLTHLEMVNLAEYNASQGLTIYELAPVSEWWAVLQHLSSNTAVFHAHLAEDLHGAVIYEMSLQGAFTQKLTQYTDLPNSTASIDISSVLTWGCFVKAGARSSRRLPIPSCDNSLERVKPVGPAPAITTGNFVAAAADIMDGMTSK